MKKYKINVNGYAYEVEIEEVAATMSGGVTTPSAPMTISQKAQSPVATSKPVSKQSNTPASGESVISAPMQGKIIDVIVGVGDPVVSGQVIAILEAMKMENEIVASSDGTVQSVGTSAGQSVEAGDLIIAMI